MIRLIALLLCLPALAAAQVRDGDIRFEIEVEAHEGAPLVGEMLILTLRGAYRPQITLESIRQPELESFDWMQLGLDQWTRTQELGIPILTLERRMAIFPQRAGTLVIEPFEHELTLLTESGRRFEHVARSNALTIEIEPPPESDAWWFPVRQLRVTDSWSNPPGRLPEGGGALRIVTLTANGAEPESLPPMPEMTGAGALIFAHPERRIVTLTGAGPITRAFWRWTIRPDAGSAGFIDPVEIAYFDATARELRTITLSAQRVSYAGAAGAGSLRPEGAAASAGGSGGAPDADDAPDANGAAAAASFLQARAIGPLIVPAAALIGLGGGLYLMRRSLRAAPARRRGPSSAGRRRALRRAARRGDAGAVWRLGAALTAGGARPAPLTELERALYDGSARPPPDLRAVVRSVLAAAPGDFRAVARSPVPGG